MTEEEKTRYLMETTNLDRETIMKKFREIDTRIIGRSHDE